MLIVYLAAIHARLVQDSNFLRGIERIPTVWVHPEDPFPEVDEFVVESSETYALDVSKRPYPLKPAFEAYLKEQPKIKAILVGIRRADPYGETLEYIQPTDHGWPEFVRVHPVLEWHFVNIWDVSIVQLTHFFVPFNLGTLPFRPSLPVAVFRNLSITTIRDTNFQRRDL